MTIFRNPNPPPQTLAIYRTEKWSVFLLIQYKSFEKVCLPLKTKGKKIYLKHFHHMEIRQRYLILVGFFRGVFLWPFKSFGNTSFRFGRNYCYSQLHQKHEQHEIEKEKLKQQSLIIEILLLFDEKLCFQETKIFLHKYSLSSALVLLFLD